MEAKKWKINEISIEYINNRPLSEPSLWVLSKLYVKFQNFAPQNSSAGCHNFLLMKFSHLVFEFIHEFRWNTHTHVYVCSKNIFMNTKFNADIWEAKNLIFIIFDSRVLALKMVGERNLHLVQKAIIFRITRRTILIRQFFKEFVNFHL